MINLAERLQRTIMTDGSFIYNCGYKLLFDQCTRTVLKKLYDVALIGVIGARHNLELPTQFNGIKIKKIHHFSVYEKTKHYPFSENGVQEIPSISNGCYLDPYILPSPAVFTLASGARCDNITVSNIALNAEAFQNLKIKTAKIDTRSSILPARTFYCCNELRNIDLMTSYKEIGRECFSQCVHLKHINLPKSIENIKSLAFYRCGLSGLVLPNCTKRIGDKAFGECSKLEFVVIPKNIGYIAPTAFEGCPQVNVVSAIGSNVEKYAAKYGLSFIPYEYVIANLLIQKLQFNK